MHMGFSGCHWVLAWSETSDGPSLNVKRVSRGLRGTFRGGHCQSAAARTFENAASQIDQSDQGFGPSITGSEQKKGQGPSEMIGGIVSGDSPISVEFTRAGIISISDRVMRG